MLRFFRTLRRRLLEESHIRKYIWYALGEIMLVMIGILLALQVNNWNEERSLLNSAEKHLILLESNLQDDYSELLHLKSEIETSLQSSINLVERYKQNREANIDSIIFEVTQLIFEFNFAPDKSAFDILVNSGELGVLSDVIREQISQYYNSVDYIDERDEISNTFIKNQYEVIVLNNYSSFWSKQNSHPALAIYNDDQRALEPINPDIILSDKVLETMVFARNFQLERQLLAYEEGLDKIMELRQSLEQR